MYVVRLNVSGSRYLKQRGNLSGWVSRFVEATKFPTRAQAEKAAQAFSGDLIVEPLDAGN